MYLGTRRIRSAGRTSGSVEITLPVTLQVLEGVNCRMAMRDGPRPEIILAPDVSAAHALFQDLWDKLRLGLSQIGELADWSLADFTLAFFPPAHWMDRPPLAYSDALAVLHRHYSDPNQGVGKNGRVAANADEALGRLLAFLGVNAGMQLGLVGNFASAFGDAIAYLMTGFPAGLGTDFERGMALRLLGDTCPTGSALERQAWLWVRPGLLRMYERFLTWQSDTASYQDDRDKWYRALTAELR